MQKFNNPRYATRGISSTLPLMLQIILWGLIDTMEVVEKDYLQIFTLHLKTASRKSFMSRNSQSTGWSTSSLLMNK